MKTLLPVALLSLALVGCGVLPQKYDNNEYENWVRMRVHTETIAGLCDTGTRAQISEALTDLHFEARVAAIYAENTPSNSDVANSAKIVAGDVVELIDFYSKNDHNVTYCKRKTDLLGRKLDAMIEVIPQKKRI